MLSLITDIFGIAKDTGSVIRDVGDERKKTRGMKNRVLGEVEFNMKLILEHYLKKHVATEKIINKLKIESLAQAVDEGFDFSKIKKGEIDEEMVAEEGFLRNYIGYDCEEILKKIRLYIEQLKLLPELYDLRNSHQVNVRTRLINLGKRYLLFTRFLKS